MVDQLPVGNLFRRLAYGLMMTIHEAFDRFGQVLEQMPPIGYLHRLRRSPSGAVCVSSGSIPADELDFRMRTQPIGKARRFSIGEEVDGLVALEIHQHRTA